MTEHIDISVLTNIVYPFETGGAQNRVHGISTWLLASRGHRVTICSRYFWDESRGLAYEGLFLHAISPAQEVYRVAIEYEVTFGRLGDGPERAALEQRARAYQSRDGISFRGFLDDYGEVLAHVEGATMFGSPSTRGGFGIPYLEAMGADCMGIDADHLESAVSEAEGDSGDTAEPTVDAIADTLRRIRASARPSNDPVAAASRYDRDTVAEKAETVSRSVVDDIEIPNERSSPSSPKVEP